MFFATLIPETMAQWIKAEALKFVGDKAWTGELALRLGAHLAQLVNGDDRLSGSQKCELVCQTILALLDDVEKAGKEHLAESTEKVDSIVHLDEIRNLVRNHLPVTLNLIVSAARGEFDLKKLRKAGVGCLSFLLPYLHRLVPCLGASAVATMSQAVTAVVAAEKKEESAPPPPTESQPSAEPEPPKVSETQEAAPAAPSLSEPAKAANPPSAPEESPVKEPESA
jgi:hypothetical protein